MSHGWFGPFLFIMNLVPNLMPCNCYVFASEYLPYEFIITLKAAEDMLGFLDEASIIFLFFLKFIYFTSDAYYIWHFSPWYPSPPSPASPPPAVSPLQLPNCPQCVMLLSLSPCILIVQHPALSENIRYLDFCSHQFAENDGFQIHPSPYKGYELIYGCVYSNKNY